MTLICPVSLAERILPVVAVLLAQALSHLVGHVHELRGEVLVLGVGDQVVLSGLQTLELLHDELVVGNFRESLEAGAHRLNQVDAHIESVGRDTALLEVRTDIDCA